MGWHADTEWRISVFVAHCLAAALDQVDTEERDDLFQIWYTTLEPFFDPAYTIPEVSPEETYGEALLVLLAKSDCDVFFPKIIGEELVRLAALATNADLPCDHAVGDHKNALSGWREKNLPT